MPQPSDRTAAAVTGTLLCRAIVPLWIAAGAIFKLVERTPGNLPSAIVKGGKSLADALGADPNATLALLLRSLIGIEFIAIGLMLFVPRLARITALFMLSVFCLILINELRLGSASCGCFGTVKIHPGVMLGIDFTLLMGVILFRPGAAGQATTAAGAASAGRLRLGALAAWLVATVGLSYAVPEKPATEQFTHVSPPQTTDGPSGGGPGIVMPPDAKPPPPSDGQVETQPKPLPPKIEPAVPPADPTVNPKPLALKSWFSPRVKEWAGKPWREVDLFQFMPRWPAGLDEGRHYVIFYSKTCDHCHSLLETHFSGERLMVPTVAIAIPPEPGSAPQQGLPMPCSKCTLMDLPSGSQWMITPPILMAVEDGVVVAAEEGVANIIKPDALPWPQ